jgi:hypothetical protein
MPSLCSRCAVLGTPAVLLVLALARPAGAFTLAFEGFEPSGDEWVDCGLDIQGNDQLVVVDPPEEPGLAVFGGFSDLLIDGNETVRFEFLAGPATGVRYAVSALEFAGGATVSGYDAELDLIDSVEVSGLGEKDVSALFGGVPLGAFRVTSAVGGHRIGSVTFAPDGGLVVLDMTHAPDVQQPSLQHCGVSVAGSGDLYVDGSTGIGVRSGPGGLDHFVEPGESIAVELDGPVTSLSYASSSSGPAVPSVSVTGFGASGAPVGPLQVDSAGPVDVTALFGGAPLTGFALDVLAGDLALTTLTVPEPGAAAAGAAGLASLARLARRRRARAAR